MNRADLQLLNQSMGGLTDTLLRNRMMQQQEKERELDRGMREQQFQEQADARKDYYQWRGKAAQDAADANRQKFQALAKEHAHKAFEDNMALMMKGVSLGVVPPDKATSVMQNAANSMPPDAQQMLSDNPTFQAVKSGDFSFQNPTPKTTAQKLPAAAIQIANEIQNHRDAAAAARDEGDDETADFHEHTADLLEQHLKKNAPKVPTVRKTVKTGGINPLTGQPNPPQTTLSGPADQVDQAAQAQPAGAAGGISPQGFLDWQKQNSVQ